MNLVEDQIGPRLTKARHDRKILGTRVPAAHALEHSVAAALERQVDVWAQCVEFAVRANQIWLEKRRMRAGVAYPLQTGNPVESRE